MVSAQPVAVVLGARQTGKSTLVAHAESTAGLLQLTLDDLETRTQALSDPEGLVSRADRMAIAEVQRAPDLLIAINRSVDRDRRPGRFVLTGSANLLAMKPVQESLAGRASYVPLWPLTRRERLGLGVAGLWQALFDTPHAQWRELLASQDVPPDSWQHAVRQSHYPPVVVGRFSAEQRSDWLQGYLDTFLDCDVAEQSAIAKPLDLSRLMKKIWC